MHIHALNGSRGSLQHIRHVFQRGLHPEREQYHGEYSATWLLGLPEHEVFITYVRGRQSVATAHSRQNPAMPPVGADAPLIYIWNLCGNQGRIRGLKQRRFQAGLKE